MCDLVFYWGLFSVCCGEHELLGELYSHCCGEHALFGVEQLGIHA